MAVGDARTNGPHIDVPRAGSRYYWRRSVLAHQSICYREVDASGQCWRVTGSGERQYAAILEGSQWHLLCMWVPEERVREGL